jgi:glyoxylase-like metal-dependent hydrolase (beta-lactamase superfamily II)
MKRLSLLAIFWLLAFPASPPPKYSIQAIRYADSPGDLVADYVVGGPKDEKVDAMYAFWLIRGGGHNILFDSGFHRQRFLERFRADNYLRPDEAVKLAGVQPEEITDIVISHAHWDHIGGIDLFPKATIWIQKEEYRYYRGVAWQQRGNHGGIDPDDVVELARLNAAGHVHFVNGDNVEIFPGIRAYTGGRHTYAAQYLRVEGNPPFVLASDNCYLYRNLTEHKASWTFSEADHPANVRNQQRMIELAGSPERVIPGHDALQFQKFPREGRIAVISP